MVNELKPSQAEITLQRTKHCEEIKSSSLPQVLDLTLSEALVIGLIRQGVKIFLTVFGHGSTEIAEVLRIYQETGLVKVFGVRSEIEASHAAAALREVTGEKAAVVTSIGPGALQAMAASLVSSSDGLGVWYLLGDETTEDEGYNMQQIPKPDQGQFLQIARTIGTAYSLHTPLSLPAALHRGMVVVDHPYRQGPFFLLLPMNTQSSWLPGFNLSELPELQSIRLPAASGEYTAAVELIHAAQKIVIKVGGGARKFGPEITGLVERSAGVLVHTPIATGCIPYSHPQNMGVGGSKGSLCGNYAMENADLLIAIGTRAVCQSDCSRTGYPNVKHVININADINDATHYNHTLPLIGDIGETVKRLSGFLKDVSSQKHLWLEDCQNYKRQWQEFKNQRRMHPTLSDAYWGKTIMTQPAAIMIAAEWAKKQKWVTFFDAGDVQANGFQVVEDDTPSQTFTETGASYMGFAVSALLATRIGSRPFKALAITGDGSFTMNPQILIDGVEHHAQGCILLLDNGRMGAISGLQNDQYGNGFATWNTIKVDYLAWARSVPGILVLDGGETPESLQNALDQASEHDGLSFISLPVYYGDDPLGGMGVYGRWNVGNWSEDVQALRHKIGL
jgi:3D-(3,5/4)-trihydroxycyclohexane-1,2-dione acylhydrolase (decyclizing)